jgi:hypothetical protein
LRLPLLIPTRVAAGRGMTSTSLGDGKSESLGETLLNDNVGSALKGVR